MFLIWWPAFLLPLAMVLCGIIGGKVPGRKYRSPKGALTEERQQFADALFTKMLWQFGFAYGALAFMWMRSVRLMGATGQRWCAGVVIVVELVGLLMMVLPVERALQEKFGAEGEDEA